MQIKPRPRLDAQHLGALESGGKCGQEGGLGDESGAPTDVPDSEEWRSAADDSIEFSAEDERRCIPDAAEAIEKQLLDFGESWEEFADEERPVAACACPEALMAELQRQIDAMPKTESPTEYACKASKH